jgi:REP element-mobilizing transposase RayT
MTGHIYHKIYLHIVWTTKKRLPLIDLTVEKILKQQFQNKAQELKIILLEFGNTEDHIHVLLKIKPTDVIAKIVKDLKGSSANFMNKKFKEDLTFQFVWQRGYGVLSVSEEKLPFIKKYIQEQKQHHRQNEISQILENTS